MVVLFKSFMLDFSHPYIEIDNNKCILCSRCVRICKEVVGANALGLVNRGFDTFVAPSMGDKLSDTNCESCGMCISTCPTGAITENVPFKAGPLALDEFTSICNYCSIGCEVKYNHKAGFVTRVTGSEGLINTEGSICRFPRFGYKYLNFSNRITQPLFKVNGVFEPISFEKAYDIIREKIHAAQPQQNAFFAGARLTNEEIYLIQKFARDGVKTNNVSSFHYAEQGNGYIGNALDNVPFNQLSQAGKIYLLGSEINNENAVAGFYIYNNSYLHNIPLTLITDKQKSKMDHKVHHRLKVDSYYYFVKAVIHHILSEGLENAVYLKDHCTDFETYKKLVLSENVQELISKSGCKKEQIVAFAQEYNNEQHAILVYAEKNISANTSIELRNLSHITGKTGKTASGLIALKEKNNSQGLIDMGAFAGFNTGGLKANDTTSTDDSLTLLKENKIKNLFIFGEDPIGTAIDEQMVSSLLTGVEFTVVQEYFMSKTAAKADLVLPASLPFEMGGSFTNTQKFIQQFEKSFEHNITQNSFDQLKALHQFMGLKSDYEIPADVLAEAASLLNQDTKSKILERTTEDNFTKLFVNGADYLHNEFLNDFDNRI
jgi:formate dehydrogenase major subunit